MKLPRENLLIFSEEEQSRKGEAFQSIGMRNPTANCDVAEGEGFEPSIPCGIRAFQARALGQLCDPSKNLGLSFRA